MKPWRTAVAGVVPLVLLVLAWGPIAVQAPGPVTLRSAPQYQLLINPGLEAYDPPYGQFQGVDCQVATGWRRFPEIPPEPCWMDTRVFANSHLGAGWVERIEGETSQLLVSTQPYTAGIWQQVSGLTPGLPYGFHAAMLTIFQSSAPPPHHGTMIKQVGIDPTGGIDPEAATIVWSEPDDHDEGPWDITRMTAAYAQAPELTVFVRVISPYEAGPSPYLNLSFFDSAILARTATVSAVSPTESETTTFLVRWDNAVPSPGAEIRWYDVQWMDEADGGWHDWFTWTTETQGDFTGERSHTYRFRARAWQRYPNGAHLFSPYLPQGDTQTYVQGPGPEVVGRVLGNEGQSLAGATVSISGTTYATVSGAQGRYRLSLRPTTQPLTINVSHPMWLAPEPVYGVALGPTETVSITWSLRPPDDVVGNGGFEAGMEGWSPFAEQGMAPEVVAEPVHTGVGAVALGGPAPAEYTAGVTQTAVLSHAWEPALAFWYRPATAAPDGVFNVVLTAVGQMVSSTLPVALDERSGLAVTRTVVFTPDLDVAEWRHLSLHPMPEGIFTGTVTIRFEVRDDSDETSTTVYLDEVSLGRTPGGPFKSYLPLVLRSH